MTINPTSLFLILRLFISFIVITNFQNINYFHLNILIVIFKWKKLILVCLWKRFLLVLRDFKLLKKKKKMKQTTIGCNKRMQDVKNIGSSIKWIFTWFKNIYIYKVEFTCLIIQNHVYEINTKTKKYFRLRWYIYIYIFDLQLYCSIPK